MGALGVCHTELRALRVFILICVIPRCHVQYQGPIPQGSSVHYDGGFAVPTVVSGTLVRTLTALCEAVEASTDSRSLAF